MIYPDVSTEEWKRRYNLPLQKVICLGCKKEFVMDRPILAQGCAGFTVREHGCPEGDVILTPIKDSAKRFWESVLAE